MPSWVAGGLPLEHRYVLAAGGVGVLAEQAHDAVLGVAETPQRAAEGVARGFIGKGKPVHGRYSRHPDDQTPHLAVDYVRTRCRPAAGTDGRGRSCDDRPDADVHVQIEGREVVECGVDTTVLKKCAARYTAPALKVGAHVLRVRAIDAKKRKSRITTVAFAIQLPPPPPPPPVGPLAVKKTVPVDAWPGNPLIAFGSVWISSAQTGSLTRLDAATGNLISKIPTSGS